MTIYDRSVWWENVDTSLLNLLKDFYYVKNGSPVSVPVKMFPINMDTTKLTYPIILVRHSNESFDIDRYDANDVKVSQQDGVAIYEQSAIPYKLSYQIDFVAEKQRDINTLVQQWISTFRPRFYLDVRDNSGEMRKCYVTQVGKPHNVDYQAVRGEDRLLRTVVLFDVNVEIDSGKQKEVRIVTKSPTINNNI